MAKTKSAKRKSNQTWSGFDHSTREANRIASLQKKRQKLLSSDVAPPHHPAASKRPRLADRVPSDAYKRTHLAHDNRDKIELSKLRLATSQIQRQVDALRERLENWDPVVEAAIAEAAADSGEIDVFAHSREEIAKKMKVEAQNRRMDREAREKAKAEMMLIEAERGVNSSVGRRKANLRKKPRPGPETWKLRGAARPAWEVYDFDTRYVDPHLKALEEHKEKVGRSVNVLALCKGRFAQDATTNDGSENDDASFPPPQPHCRTYLSLLTQLGSLQLTRKNYSSARSSFLTAVELEGYSHPHSITNARNQLMNMYLSTNRPSSARKLWEALSRDGSAWIRYSAALLEYVSWNLLGEEGSTPASAERALCRAIRGNVYVAYLLGWRTMFEKAMEYTEDVVEWGDGESGSIMEAVEYFGCGVGTGGEERGMGLWLGTEGSLEWVRSVALRVLRGESVGGKDGLEKDDLLRWETLLAQEEEVFEKKRGEKGSNASDDEQPDNDNNLEEEEPDLLMYAGMFRTAMDWLQDAGEFLKSPSYDFVNETEKDATDAAADRSSPVENDVKNVSEGSSNRSDDGSEDSDSEDSAEDSDSEVSK